MLPMKPPIMNEWVGLREFARRCGRRHRAAQAAIADGRIPAALVRRDAKGRIVGIEFPAARDAWIQATDPSRTPLLLTVSPAPGPVHTSAPPAVRDVAPSADEPAAAGNTDQGRYLAARAEREEVALRRDKLDYFERIGALVSVAAVRKEALSTARSVRNAMLAIPDRIAPVLDPANPARAHKLITGEIQKVLRELSLALEQRAVAPDDGTSPAN